MKNILTQFLSLKKNFNFATFTLIVDMIIIILGWTVTGEISVAIYTIIRLIIYIIVMDKLHTIYNYVKLSIVTEKVEEVREALLTVAETTTNATFVELKEPEVDPVPVKPKEDFSPKIVAVIKTNQCSIEITDQASSTFLNHLIGAMTHA